MSGYDFIAPFYNVLSRIIFGKTLIKASDWFIPDLINCQNLLIVGGGSGSVLNTLRENGFKGRITFVDSSKGMINRARLKSGGLRVEFQCTKFLEFNGKGYDGFHMAFFIDQFKEETVEKTVLHLKNLLNPEAVGSVVDFINAPGTFYKGLLRSMYIFFGVFTGIESSNLTNWQDRFTALSFRPVKSKQFYKNRIEANLYKG